MAKLVIKTFNAKGLDDYSKRKDVFRWFKKKNPDILMIQESHSNKGKEKVWNREWETKIVYSHGDSNARGVCVCFKKELNYVINNLSRDKDGRILVLDITVDDYRFTLANIYAPNKDTPQFFDKLFDMIDQFHNTSIIIGGDFNLVFNVTIDKKGGRPVTHENCKKNLLGWMEELGLIDIWRFNNKDKFMYTWKSYKKPHVFCRLDFFLISTNLTSVSKDNTISPGYRSDHNIVSTTLSNENEKRGPGFWKLNCSLLDNQEYCNAIINCIENCNAENKGTEDSLLWETMKCRIRGTSVKIGAKLKREKSTTKKDLEFKLAQLMEDITLIKEDKDIENCALEISNLEKELELLNKVEAEGIRLRSKCQYYEQGEKSTKYFHSLEKRNQENKHIKLLLDDNDKEIKGVKNILQEEVRFYRDLYKSQLFKTDKDVLEKLYKVFLKDKVLQADNNIPDITNCFNEEEIKEIIDSIENGKSPGSDGLPIEFYKKFWPHIKTFVINSYKDIWKNKHLGISQRQGIISLIPKKNKDPKKLTNWRPITLLNTDYKILTKGIAQYMKTYLQDIINYNQKGFLSGRFIGENINNVLSIMEHCDKFDINAILVFLDYNKAFDCVEWSIIDKTLCHFGFKENLRHWLKSIYYDNVSFIVNNGHISQMFNLERGLRQGCPLSPYLFILIVELLSNVVRENNIIKGIKIGESTSKIHQYADDTFLSIVNEKICLDELFTVINDFSKISGLCLNKNKTEILKLGKTNYDIDDFYKPWVKKKVTLLGTTISRNLAEIQIDNYTDKIKKITNCLNIWKLRDLSLIGRIHIIKSLASSQLIFHLSTIMSPTESFFKEVESLFYQFLWNSKVERIKRNMMIAPYHEGGLNMLDIRCQNQALKLKWIERLINQVECEYKDIWASWLISKCNKVDILYLLKCNLCYTDLDKVINLPKNNPWHEILIEWCKYNFDVLPWNNNDILNQNIWFNSLIKINKKMLFNKSWYTNGIKTIIDLRIENRWLTAAELNAKHNTPVNFLELLSIQKAIPASWNKHFELINEDYVHKIDSTIFITKHLYNDVIKKKFVLTEEFAVYWRNEFKIELDELEWIESYIECFNWTISSKLRSFYFQLRCKDIMTNAKLFQMKKRLDPYCNWCTSNYQDSIHLFWECKKVKPIWNVITNWINVQLNCELEIKKELLFLYDIEAGNYTTIINLVILIVCRYIYVSKCTDRHPTFTGAIAKVKEVEFIERDMAQRKGKLLNHLKKWSTLIER